MFQYVTLPLYQTQPFFLLLTVFCLGSRLFIPWEDVWENPAGTLLMGRMSLSGRRSSTIFIQTRPRKTFRSSRSSWPTLRVVTPRKCQEKQRVIPRKHRFDLFLTFLLLNFLLLLSASSILHSRSVLFNMQKPENKQKK